MARTEEERAARDAARKAEREEDRKARQPVSGDPDVEPEPRVRKPSDPADDFTGDELLRKGTGKLILDGFGHWGIALGAGLLVFPAAYFLSAGWFWSMLSGSGLGIAALVLREVIQLVTSKKLHWKDRLADVAPGFFGGGFGGMLAWLAARALAG